MTTAALGPLETKGWHARLELTFERFGKTTQLRRSRHQGPYVVQRPFSEPGGTCQVYLIHPPGGLVGGDELRLRVDCGENTSVLLTTPGATKLYRSSGRTAALVSELKIAQGARLEWLPQETIVFNGARARSTTRIELDHDAHFSGWEIVCLGRRAAAETYRNGDFEQRVEIFRAGEPVWLERSHFLGDDVMLSAAWGMRGHSVVGTFLCSGLMAPVTASLIAALTLAAEMTPILGLYAVSQIDDLVVCRYLGDNAHEARRVFQVVWSLLRPLYSGIAACPPRIWAT